MAGLRKYIIMATIPQALDHVSTTLAQAYTAGSGSIVVATGDGSKFGSPSALSPIYLTATSGIGLNETVTTRLIITARTGDTLTVAAAVSGFSDVSLGAGTIVSNRGGAAEWNALVGDYVSQTGTYSNPTWVASLDASKLTTGTVSTARLGSGTASAGTFLRGDQTWSSGPTGPQGPQGYQGASGAQGPQGYQGNQGSSPTVGGANGNLLYNNSSAIGGASWSAIANSGSLLTATCAANTDKVATIVANVTTATITNIAITSNIATITTSATHNFIVGRWVTLSGLTTVSSLNNQRHAILTVTSNTFTFNCSVASQASASETGSAVSSTTSVPAIEIQDGSGLVTTTLRVQASSVITTVTTPMSAPSVLDTWNHTTHGQNSIRVFPWLTYHNTTMYSHGIAARIAWRSGYSAATTYDGAAIDLGGTESNGNGRIRFYTGGNGNGATLIYAGEFNAAGQLSLTKPLILPNSSGQNAQIGYSNYPDANANLMVTGIGSQKALVMQCAATVNTFELQQYNSNTVIGGITVNGNWWMGGTAGSTTTRVLVSARQTTDCALAVQAITSQTGNLFEARNSSGSALLSIRLDGSVQPASMADSSAVNDSIYYSTTQNKLVYKDSSGVVNNLY